MLELLTPLKKTVNQSAKDDLEYWLSSMPDRAAWYVISDYCFGDKTKQNDTVSFTVLLNCDVVIVIIEFGGSVSRPLGVLCFEVKMEYLEVESTEIPIQLLLEADPSEQSIRSYLSDSWCYVAKNNGQIVGACIAKLICASTAEIFNIAVYPDHQQQGIGSGLIRLALNELANKKIHRVELGTGTFGYQLTYYQRIGFRVDSVVKEHFLANYPEPIFENGIQHKDMLRLYIEF